MVSMGDADAKDLYVASLREARVSCFKIHTRQEPISRTCKDMSNRDKDRKSRSIDECLMFYVDERVNKRNQCKVDIHGFCLGPVAEKYIV